MVLESGVSLLGRFRRLEIFPLAFFNLFWIGWYHQKILVFNDSMVASDGGFQPVNSVGLHCFLGASHGCSKLARGFRGLENPRCRWTSGYFFVRGVLCAFER